MTDAHDDARRATVQDPNGHAAHDAKHDDAARDPGGDAAANEARGKGPGGTFTEEFRVSGEALVAKVKALLREGNIRRITIKNDEGRTLIEIPLTIGVIGTALLPVWAAIGAIAALVANLTLAVERVDEGAPRQGDEATTSDAASAPTGGDA